MELKESVSVCIRGVQEEQERRNDLWNAIVGAYEMGGGDGIKSLLVQRAEDLSTRFSKLIENLSEEL